MKKNLDLGALHSGLIAEAKILAKEHPSKDCRFFAKSVLKYFDAERKAVFRLWGKKKSKEND